MSRVSADAEIAQGGRELELRISRSRSYHSNLSRASSASASSIGISGLIVSDNSD